MHRKRFDEMNCSVHASAGTDRKLVDTVVGAGSLIGTTTSRASCERLGTAKNILTERLKRLVALGSSAECSQAKPSSLIVLMVRDTEALTATVEQNLGVTIMPELAVPLAGEVVLSAVPRSRGHRSAGSPAPPRSA